jgi:hypothetical protein
VAKGVVRKRGDPCRVETNAGGRVGDIGLRAGNVYIERIRVCKQIARPHRKSQHRLADGDEVLSVLAVVQMRSLRNT